MEKSKEVAMSYLPCARPDHDGEVLNLICIEKSCPSKGLVCSLCREEHVNHRVRPLKVLLANLRTEMNEKVEDEYCNRLEELEELKNGLLYGLKTSVDRLAAAFQQLEQDILDQYQRNKMDIIEQVLAAPARSSSTCSCPNWWQPHWQAPPRPNNTGRTSPSWPNGSTTRTRTSTLVQISRLQSTVSAEHASKLSPN